MAVTMDGLDPDIGLRQQPGCRSELHRVAGKTLETAAPGAIRIGTSCGQKYAQPVRDTLYERSDHGRSNRGEESLP